MKSKAKPTEGNLPRIPSFTLITLFSQTSDPGRDTLSLLSSALLHGVLSVLLYAGFTHTPQVYHPLLKAHYTVRTVEMHMPHPPIYLPLPGNKTDSPKPSVDNTKSLGDNRSTAPAKSLAAPLKADSLQVLIQPDIPTLPVQKPIPVPLLIVRATADALDKKIVPPPPQKDIAANTPATLDAPNREQTLSDIAINSTPFESKTQPVLPSTTTVLTMQGPAPKQEAPQTASVESTKPSSATITALSDLRVPEGVIVLPPVTVKASSSASEGLSSSSSTGSNKHDPALPTDTPTQRSAGSDSGAATASTTTAGGSGSGAAPSMKRIILPKDGKFSVVTVGNSIEDLYPESEGMWKGRTAYTVYLHVGLAKNWILQYSLPLSDETPGTGSAGRLDPPWPLDILVPNLPPGSYTSSALVAHGTLDAEGRFQQLSVVFPPDFELAKYVTETLEHWVFRPAMQSGKAVLVEVLLIIPETAE